MDFRLTDTADRLQAALADSYRLERELGRGGMATVYLAQDLKHRRLVALKVLHPELAATIGPERFLREIEVTAGLDHPHILPMLDSGDAGGLLWYTMPYVEGESLRDRLRREIQLPVDDAVRIAREVADGLEYAHRHRVVHRDIKPENILLAHGHARVADFGVAQALESAGSDRLTGTGLAIGTLLYMSPEQSGGGGELDGRSDLYSLGCVLYEMLAGEPPFTGRTPQAIIAKRLSDAVPAVRRVRPTVPPGLDSALTKALAPVPADRFPTIGEFAAALVSAAAVGQARQLPVPAVLALYTLAALAVLGLAYLLTTALGLPDWVPPAALVLLAVGLPIILATAVLPRRSQNRAPWLTWRRALSGGALAFGALGVVTAGYMAMRALGIGPVGSLLAAGVLKERERVLLADFENRTADSLLGGAVTEAFRVDLAQSPVVSLVPSEQMADALKRMQRPATAKIDAALAREIALREGIKAIVTGEIASAGPQVVLSAQVISPRTGEVLAAQRGTAGDSTEIMGTVDRVSKKLRERIGESLKSLRVEPPLEQVTTGSLAALRRYSQARRMMNQGGDDGAAIDLFSEAVALDTAFAMAYRALGFALAARGTEPARADEALTKAFRHRDRLTDRERYLTEAGYYSHVTSELDKEVGAYRALLESDPNDPTALNNLGSLYIGLHQYARAEPLFRQLVTVDSASLTPALNLVTVEASLGKRREAELAMSRALDRFPQSPWISLHASGLAYLYHDYRGAEAHILRLRDQHSESLFWRAVASKRLSMLASVRGRLMEAERYLQDAMDAAVQDGDTVHYVELSTWQAALDIDLRGAPGRGLKRVETALRRFPLDSLEPLDRPYLTLAVTYADAGQPQRARHLLAEYELVNDSTQRRGDESDWHGVLGDVARAENRPDDAVAEYRQQAVRDECSICPSMGLGRAYDQGRQPDSAIADYERYVTTPFIDRMWYDATWLPGVLKRLGELYEAGNQREKARNYYSRFVDLWKDCDPELRPAVVEVRRRLADLAGE